MRTKVIVAAVVVSALGAVGCGSSGPLTAAQLTTKANAICRERNAEIAALRRRSGGNIRAMVAPALPIETKAVNALAALKPPASAKTDWERLVAIEKVYLARFKRLAHGTGKSIEDVQQTHEMARLVSVLKLGDC
jgi:hypothetical protein